MSTLSRKTIQKERDVYGDILSKHMTTAHASQDNDGPGSPVTAGNDHDAF